MASSFHFYKEISWRLSYSFYLTVAYMGVFVQLCIYRHMRVILRMSTQIYGY